MQTRAEFIRESIGVIRSLYRKGDFVSALKGCRELLNVAPGDMDVLGWKEKIESAFVRSQLPLRKTLLKAGEYDKLYAFYQKLYRICPHVPVVVRLMAQCERLIEKKRLQEQSVHVKEIEQKISSNFTAKRWQKVREHCQEILQINAHHPFALRMLVRVQKEENRETNVALSVRLPEMRRMLIDEFRKTPEKFRRI